jgi:hypothetical protein
MKKLILPLVFCSTSIMAFAQNLPVSQTAMNKNAILEELTGINCQYCPDGHKRAAQVAAANPGRVVLVNIHAGGYANATPDFRTTDGTAIDGFFNASGYPAGSVQRTPFAAETALATGRGNWTSQVNTTLAQSSPANIALDATIDAVSRVVTVTVEAFYTSPYASGTTHYINVGILQDDLESAQSGAAQWYPEMIQSNGLYQHKHMFRGFINNGGTWGDPIDASVGTVITRTYTYTLPASINSNDLTLGKLKFFTMLHVGHNSYSNSPAITAAEVVPAYTNVSDPSADLNSIVNSFNICDGGSIVPVVKIVNNGSAITTIDLQATVNGGTPVPFTYNGSIPTFGTAEVTLPSMVVNSIGSDNIVVDILTVNGSAAYVGTVATQTEPISIATTGPSTNLTVKMTSDRYGSELTWKIFNSSNTIVASGGPYTDAAASGAYPMPDVNVTVANNDCYRAVVYDSYGDGFDSGYGNGDFKVVSGGINAATVVTFSGAEMEDAMFISEVAGLDELSNMNVSVFPNPATANVNVSFDAADVDYTVVIMDLQGRAVTSEFNNESKGMQTITIPVSELASGSYLVSISSATGKTTKNVVIK